MHAKGEETLDHATSPAAVAHQNGMNSRLTTYVKLETTVSQGTKPRKLGMNNRC
jgi:hypothetical protein